MNWGVGIFQLAGGCWRTGANPYGWTVDALVKLLAVLVYPVLKYSITLLLRFPAIRRGANRGRNESVGYAESL